MGWPQLDLMKTKIPIKPNKKIIVPIRFNRLKNTGFISYIHYQILI